MKCLVYVGATKKAPEGAFVINLFWLKLAERHMVVELSDGYDGVFCNIYVVVACRMLCL